MVFSVNSIDTEIMTIVMGRPFLDGGWFEEKEGKDVVTVYIFRLLSESYRDLGTLV